MSFKAKLITIFMSLLLVLSIMVMAVFSTQTAIINLGGQVSFKATNVNCEVSGLFENALEPVSLSTLKWNATTEPVNGSDELNSWSNANLQFKEDGSAITFTITFKNLSTQNYMKVKLSETTASQAVTAYGKAYTYRVYNTSSPSGTLTTYTLGTDVEVSANYTLEMVITFTVPDPNVSVEAKSYGYTITMNDQSVYGD